LFIGINNNIGVVFLTQIKLKIIQREKLSGFKATAGFIKMGMFVIELKINICLVGKFLQTHIQNREIKKFTSER
jgi:hypothetical protein